MLCIGQRASPAHFLTPSLLHSLTFSGIGCIIELMYKVHFHDGYRLTYPK